MFKLILTTLYTIRARQTPIFLGRWKLKYEEQQINRCVLWANEDNCGCCNIDLPKFENDLDDDYYLPYII
jgi:hypothetical protein